MVTERKDIVIGAKDQTRGAINSVKSGIKSVGTSWMEVAKGMLAWNVFVQLGRAAIDFTKGTIEAFKKQEQALARLTGALKNQNQYTEENIQALKDQAKALQNLTTFGDEQIISAQAMLASFALTTEQIKEMTPRMLDLAVMTQKTTGGQMDLEQAAKFVGMALGGQAGRLTQAGIRLDDYQKKAFQAANENERFNMLLEIFDQNAGGLAESVGRTATGAMERFQNAIGDLYEDIGAELIPIIVDDLIPALKAILPIVVRFAKIAIKLIKLVIEEFKKFYEKTKWIWENLGKAVDWFSKTVDKALDKTKTKTEETKQTAADFYDLVRKEAKETADVVVTQEKKKTDAIEKEEKKREEILEKARKRGEEQRQKELEATQEFSEKRGQMLLEGYERQYDAIDKLTDHFKKKIATAIASSFWSPQIEGALNEFNISAISLLGSIANQFFSFADKMKAESRSKIEQASEVSKMTPTFFKALSRGKEMGAFSAEQGKSVLEKFQKLTGAKEWGEAIVFMSEVIREFGDTRTSLQKIMGMKSGGIVTKPTIALLGEEEPEAVIPLKSQKNITSNYTININAGAFMGNKNQAMQFAKLIYFNIKEIERRDLTV